MPEIPHPEIIKPSDLSIRFHHLDNWIHFFCDWTGKRNHHERFIERMCEGKLAIISIFQEQNEVIKQKPKRKPPWAYGDQPERALKEIHEFCLIEANRDVNRSLESYLQETSLLAQVNKLKQLLLEAETENHQQLVSVMTALQNMLAYSYNYKIHSSWKSNTLLSNEHTKELLLFIANNDIKGCRSLLQKVMKEPKNALNYWLPEFRQDVKIFLSTLNKVKTNQVLKEIFRELTECLPSVKLRLIKKGLFKIIHDPVELQKWLNEVSTPLQSKVIYYEDILGKNPTLASTQFQAHRNQTFIAMYRMLRTALLEPNRQVIFTFEPDLICQTMRGKESLVGYHCLVGGLERSLSGGHGDYLMSQALQTVLNSSVVGEEVRSAIKMVTNSAGILTQLRLPIHLLFDYELMCQVEEVNLDLIMKLPDLETKVDDFDDDDDD